MLFDEDRKIRGPLQKRRSCTVFERLVKHVGEPCVRNVLAVLATLPDFAPAAALKAADPQTASLDVLVGVPTGIIQRLNIKCSQRRNITVIAEWLNDNQSHGMRWTFDQSVTPWQVVASHEVQFL